MKSSIESISKSDLESIIRPSPLRVLFFKSFRIALLVSGFSVIASGIAGGFYLHEAGVFDVSDESLKAITDHRPQDNTLIFDRHGTKIGEHFNSYHVFIPYDEIPKSLIQAVLAIEDRNFFRHLGVDILAITRAGIKTLKQGKYTQGASTLTQQLVRGFLLTRDKTIERKLREAALAVRLEQKISKHRIFELYANTMFLGFGSYGIGAAAKRYFGKKVQDLEIHESALIAGLFQSPSRYNPIRFPSRALARQRQVLNAMYKARFLSKSELLKARKLKLKYTNYKPLNQQVAPYFIDYVSEQAAEVLDLGNIKNRGLRIHTTLDARLQKKAVQTIGSSKNHYAKAQRMVYQRNKGQKPPRVEAALVSIDPHTGEILAMVGGRDYAESNFNRATQALRSPGSAFKPVVYSLALQKGKTWADVIYVSPVAVSGYKPRNYKNSFLTESTLLRAFYLSLNTPTIEVGRTLGVPAILEQAQRLGIRTKLKSEAGTMLGSSEVTMLDLASMYGTFANGGTRVKPISISKITDRNGRILYDAPPLTKRSERAINSQIAYLMVRAMQDVFRYGTASKESNFSRKAAGKTGTSNDAEDNWFCGFYPNLASVVWIGTDDHTAIVDGSGSYLALPLWTKYMGQASKYIKPGSFQRPPGLTQARVHARYGYLNNSGVEMFFFAGTKPNARHSDLEVVGSSARSYRGLFDR